MIEQNVQVLRCEGERFWVRMGARSGCTACDNGKGCGAGLFARLIRNKPVVLELAKDDMEIEAGQMLTLAFPERVYMKMVFASYGWPLLAALAGAFAGHGLGQWLQFSPFIIDAVTLAGGVLLAWSYMGFFRRRITASKIIESMDVTICLSSNNPNMCKGRMNKPEQV